MTEIETKTTKLTGAEIFLEGLKKKALIRFSVIPEGLFYQYTKLYTIKVILHTFL